MRSASLVGYLADVIPATPAFTASAKWEATPVKRPARRGRRRQPPGSTRNARRLTGACCWTRQVHPKSPPASVGGFLLSSPRRGPTHASRLAEQPDRVAAERSRFEGVHPLLRLHAECWYMSGMETNRRRTAVDAKRGTLFLCETDQLTLVTDPKHPLYDSRVKLPVPEWLVASVAQHGIIEPIVARKNGKLLEIVDGRQRYRAACAANKCGADVKVPTILRSEEDAEAAVTMIVTNEHRQDDDILTKAAKAARLLKHGHSRTDVAAAFRVSIPTLAAWEQALSLHPEVKEAIRSGAVGVTLAVKQLSHHPREEQPSRLARLVAARPAPGPGEKRPVKDSVARRLKFIRKRVELLPASERVLISFILGGANLGDLGERYLPLSNALIIDMMPVTKRGAR